MADNNDQSLSLIHNYRPQKKVTLPRVNTSIDTTYKNFCIKLSRARCVNDLSWLVNGELCEMELDDFLFIRLERQWPTQSNNGMLFSLPEEMIRAYCEERLFKSDLLLQYGKENTQPIFSSQIYGYIDAAPFDMDLTQKNRQMVQLYRRFGYSELCAIPAPAYNGSGHVMLIVTYSGRDVDEFRARMISMMPGCRSLCNAIDSVSTKKFRTSFIDPVDCPGILTRKPLAALRMLATEDKTITDIAQDLCISPITAHQHLAAARKALGVKTNVAAVVKAIKLGILDVNN